VILRGIVGWLSGVPGLSGDNQWTNGAWSNPFVGCPNARLRGRVVEATLVIVAALLSHG